MRNTLRVKRGRNPECFEGRAGFISTLGTTNPLFLREQTGLNKQQVNYALRQLIAAGWVTKVTEGFMNSLTIPEMVTFELMIIRPSLPPKQL